MALNVLKFYPGTFGNLYDVIDYVLNLLRNNLGWTCHVPLEKEMKKMKTHFSFCATPLNR